MCEMEPRELRPQRPRPNLFAASVFYLLAEVGLWGVALFGGQIAEWVVGIWPGVTTYQLELGINALYYGLFLLIPLSVWSARRKDAVDLLRLNPVSAGTAIRTTVIAVLCMLIVQEGSIFWMVLWQKLGFNVFVSSFVRPADTAELTRAMITVAIIAPVCEELLFRGVLFQAWEARGTRKAIGVTALLFAMLHGSLMGLPGEIFGGVILALLVLWTDSLYTGMIFHSVYNAAALLMNVFSSGASVEESAETASLMYTDLVAYLGGWGTMAALLVDIALMGLLVAVLMRRLRVTAVLRQAAMEAAPDGDLTDALERMRAGEKLIDPQRARELKRSNFVLPVRTPLSAGEILLIMAGAASCLAMYLFDVLSMLGG